MLQRQPARMPETSGQRYYKKSGCHLPYNNALCCAVVTCTVTRMSPGILIDNKTVPKEWRVVYNNGGLVDKRLDDEMLQERRRSGVNQTAPD